jgi:hypothetical protein
MKSAARSPIIITDALVLPPMTDGITEASATRSLSMPGTRSACAPVSTVRFGRPAARSR